MCRRLRIDLRLLQIWFWRQCAATYVETHPVPATQVLDARIARPIFRLCPGHDACLVPRRAAHCGRITGYRTTIPTQCLAGIILSDWTTDIVVDIRPQRPLHPCKRRIKPNVDPNRVGPRPYGHGVMSPGVAIVGLMHVVARRAGNLRYRSPLLCDVMEVDPRHLHDIEQRYRALGQFSRSVLSGQNQPSIGGRYLQSDVVNVPLGQHTFGGLYRAVDIYPPPDQQQRLVCCCVQYFQGVLPRAIHDLSTIPTGHVVGD